MLAASPSSATDTIFACASSAALAERLVVRISGSRALEVAEALGVPPARERICVDVVLSIRGRWSARLPLPARVLLFPGPRSYTGEDSIELHLPSSPGIAALVTDELTARGLRAAGPGEFTRRAFESGRIGLAQAEAVCDLIQATDAEELRRATAMLADGVDEERAVLRASLLDLVAVLESGLDFTEDETGAVEDDAWLPQLEELVARARRLQAIDGGASRARLPSFVLAGPPNAGKTTLWNALRTDACSGAEDGIVADLAGTTRDVRWARVDAGDDAIRIGDSPGQGSDAPGGHALELEILRTEIAQADGFVWVQAAAEAVDVPRALGVPALVVASKAELDAAVAPPGALRVSARTGEGVDALRAALTRLGAGGGERQASAASRRRALADATEALEAALAQRAVGHELVVAELRVAAAALAPEDAGAVPEDLLDRIFGRFCLGK